VQEFTLHPGWNAVFLEVQPGLSPSPPAGCTPAADRTLPEPCEIFGGVPGIESVWAWNPRTSTVEFVQNPTLPVQGTPYMLSWFPGQPLASNLHAITGETAYLIHRDESSPGDVTITVTGEPTIPRIKWVANSFNLVGFHLVPGGEPLFMDFFSGSPAHAGQEVFVLDNATGSWVEVTSPTARMRAGEAFWVYSKGASGFQGPISVTLASGVGLDYGQSLVEQEVRVKNTSAVMRSVAVSSDTPPGSSAAPVHYWEHTPDNPAGRWIDLGASPLSLSIEPGGEQSLRLGVVRAGLAAGAVAESNLRVTELTGLEPSGSRVVLPVRAVGVGKAGLWVGDVTASKVRGGTQADPTPVGTPFVFRVIIHVSDDPTPQVRLLQEVVQLWQEGTWKPDPERLGHQIVDQPGRFVLVANPALLAIDPPSGFRGAALRDGQEVGRRISSVAFGPMAPLPADGGSTFSLGGQVSFDVSMPANDPANPFLHRFHKEHSDAGSSYGITRYITLTLGSYDGGTLNTGVPFLSWGSTEVGGVYEEDLSLQRSANDGPYTVKLKGTFHLQRVSDVARLEL
jgi:hypothetical protein